MTPEETMKVLSETFAECFLDGPPLGALEGADAQEAWLDLTATIVTTLMSRGLYIVESEMYDAVIKYQRAQAGRVTYDIPAKQG